MRDSGAVPARTVPDVVTLIAGITRTGAQAVVTEVVVLVLSTVIIKTGAQAVVIVVLVVIVAVDLVGLGRSGEAVLVVLGRNSEAVLIDEVVVLFQILDEHLVQLVETLSSIGLARRVDGRGLAEPLPCLVFAVGVEEGISVGVEQPRAPSPAPLVGELGDLQRNDAGLGVPLVTPDARLDDPQLNLGRPARRPGFWPGDNVQGRSSRPRPRSQSAISGR